MSFTVTILGSGAALPTAQRQPTSQYISCNDRHLLIDCGEGTQTQLRKAGIKLQKINHIFISHLHGDHYFGLVGLLSSMHLLGRDAGINVYGPKELEQIIRLQLEIGGAKIGFPLNFHPTFNDTKRKLFEDKMIEVWSFPLKHKIPTTGFLVQEKPKERSILGEEFKNAQLSLTAIPKFRKGENFIDENGVEFDYNDFTFPPKPSFSYAFCSDTAYHTALCEFINNVTVLYHEATFLEKDKERAKATFHSTALQAAEIALKSNVKKLLLGHLSARYESDQAHQIEAATLFPLARVVKDLETIVIRF
jgi:ribonuclease Z